MPKMHLTEMCEALAALRPHTWGHLDPSSLGSLLRANGVRVGTVWSRAAGKDGKGIKREWLADDDTDEDDGGEVVNLTGRRAT